MTCDNRLDALVDRAERQKMNLRNEIITVMLALGVGAGASLAAAVTL